MKCPICNDECNAHIIDTLDGLPVEEVFKCNDCLYRHYHAYGYTTTTIGGVIIDRSPNDSEKVSELKEGIIEMAIQISREGME